MTRAALALSIALASLAACERNAAPSRTPPAQHVQGAAGAPILPAPEAVARADVTRADPEVLTDADVAKVLPPGPGCRFAYSRASPPIVVVRAAEGNRAGEGVLKLHGALVELRPTSDAGFSTLKAGVRLSADGIEIAVVPVGETDREVREADLRFRLREGLEVGYRGFYICSSPVGAVATEP